MNITIIFGFMMIIIAGLTMAMILTFNPGKKKKAAISTNKPKLGKTAVVSISTYYKIFSALNKFFVTRPGLRKIHDRLAEFSIYTPAELVVKSTQFYIVSTGLGGLIILLSALSFRDLFSTLLCVVLATVVKTSIIYKQLDSVHFKLMKELGEAISSLRQAYLRLNSIPDAIAECETGPLVSRAFDEIYIILTSTEDEMRLQQFYASTPFHLLQTLAGVCFEINNSGDTRLRDNTSNFIQALSMLSTEIQLEVKKIVMQKAQFGLLEILPLAPIPFVGVVTSFLSERIPGTSVIYHGSIGYITGILLILTSMMGYSVIVKINSAIPIEVDDRSLWISKLLNHKGFKKFIKDIQPKKEKKIKPKINLIRRALSRGDLDYLYSRKVVYSAVALVFSIIATLFIFNLSREFTYNNVQELSLLGGEKLTEKDIAIRKDMDASYLANDKKSDKDVAKIVAARLPKLQEYDRQAQVQRLQKKWDLYHNAHFKWWTLLICYMIAFVFWNVPELILRMRSMIVKTEAEEDILQLQTIISILMNTSCDTLDILHWMQRQSRIHRHVLLDAYHSYPSDPEKSMWRLKSQVPLPSFKKLVDNLSLTIHQISLEEAFSDLVSDKDHILRLREISREASLRKKRALVAPLSLLPFILVAVGYILVPLGILGFQTITQTMMKA